MRMKSGHEATAPCQAGRKFFCLGVGCFLLLAFVAAAAGADPEYLLTKPLTMDVGGQKVELNAGQPVTVLGVNNGTAMIRVTLPNGSISVIQAPAAGLQKMPAQPAPSVPAASATPSPAATVKVQPDQARDLQTAKPPRSKSEVDALIDAAGKEKPDWWNATPLNVPPTLDLTWKTQGGAKGSIGNYLWNVIYPNPGKWKEGVKLLHQSLSVSSGDASAQAKAAGALSGIYSEMLGDYPRGAFWAKKCPQRELTLADCYLKLGCPSAAIDILRKTGSDQTRHGQAIKLWAELGDLKTALEWAEDLAPGNPTVANLAAGDACRRAGKIPEALAYYEKVLAVTQQVQRDDPVNKKRAAASIEAIRLFDSLDLTKIADGTYKADSVGYVGPVEVTIRVKSHKIDAVDITSHHEKQFYSSLVDVPKQIIAKQTVKGIDTTTGATVTSEAIINASAKALAGAKK